MQINNISNVSFGDELVKTPSINPLNRLYKIFVAALFIYCTITIINKQLKKSQVKKIYPFSPPTPKVFDPLPGIKLESTKQWVTIYSKEYQQNEEWRQNAVKSLRQKYYQDPKFEIARLEGGVLTQGWHIKIDETLKKLAIYPITNPQKAAWGKVMIARALEIKSIFSQTHYTFTHAQSTQWFVISILAKELLKRQKPYKDFRSMKYLRDMVSFEKGKAIGDKLEKIVDSFKRKFPRLGNWVVNTSFGKSINRGIQKRKKKPETLQEFIKKQFFFNDEQGEQRIKLLSVSGYLLDTSPLESALHFLVNNNNILNDKSAISKVINIMMKEAFSNFEEKILYAYGDQITQAIPNGNYPCGNLFVVCIPKERVSEIAYRAHPYGKPCDCHPAKESDSILERVQKDEIVAVTQCKQSSFHGQIPQWRVFLPQLQNRDEEEQKEMSDKDKAKKIYKEKIRTYRLSPIPKPVRDNFKNVVRNVLNALFAQLEQIKK